jgi:hypothetical protein
LVSAAFAAANKGPALVYSLRMVAALGLALLVAVVHPDSLRRGLRATAAGAALVAVLAVLEAAGLQSLDPLLDLFRAQPFQVGELRRASGASENPNLAAATLMYGLLALVAAEGRGRRARAIAIPVVALLAGGLVFTYSRGALVAAGLGLVVLAASPGSPGGRRVLPVLTLGMLLTGALAWLWAGPEAQWRRRVEADGSGYGAHYEPEDAFLSLGPGESRRVRIRLANTGPAGWGRDLPLYLSHTWYDLTRRVPLDKRYDPLPAPQLRPGESLALEVELRSPEKPGRYLLVWDIDEPGVGAFSSLGVEPALVPVSVSATPEAPFQVSLPQGAWRRGRLEMWRLALVMWRAHPLTGVGPDNYRWLHGAYGGWLAWSVSNRAHNTYLELAATTGLLGLTTLLGTLAFTSRAAWRGLRRAPAGSDEAAVAIALLGLVVGIASHGVVDDCLPFTGHYLFLGFVVGAASALDRNVVPPDP